jgi:kynurenine formamidase
VDLSVVLSKDLPVTWTGAGAGNHRHPYLKADFLYAANLGLNHHTHVLDSHAGTHLVPPSYALPREGFDNSRYEPRVREWLAEYERKYGPRGFSSMTTEQVPLAWTSGRARVIDVRHRVGTTDKKQWPASPEITPDDIQQYEKRHGRLAAGDVVIFHCGHTDKFFKPMPDGTACVSEPLNGKSEGWPAPGPDAIRYLAKQGIRAVAIDAPSLGGVEPRRALMTYWALGTSGMVAVEFLTNIERVPEKAHFLFAAIKIQNCHGGPGRAIALY